MVIRNSILLLGLIITGLCPLSAQVEEGKIIYTVDDTSSKAPTFGNLNADAEIHYFFQGKKSKVYSGNPTNNYTQYSNGEEGLLLIQSMGQKNAYPATSRQLNEYFDKSREYEYSNISDTSSTIIGYLCKIARIDYPSGRKIILHYAPELNPQTNDFQYSFKEVEGLPLKIEIINNDGSATVYVATGFSKLSKRDDDFFSLEIPEGHQTNDFDELLRMKQIFEAPRK